MELETQLKILIDDASNYGISPIVIQKAIAPVLRLFAQQLKHSEYYIWQNLKEEWVLTTINNPQLDREKRVIYAFGGVKDAAAAQTNKADPDLLAAPIPVTHLLFRAISLSQVDSIIFFDTPGDFNRGTEIQRERLSALIQQQIKQLNQIPPNIA